ncbi:hypothetical protein BB560_002487 [Smittium megazygosporum]|uniref:Uncharacterized protein n=1 Tax=Smittium megazygosporum TaxID=133381 RepID=A0A2T9ZEQ2_9FUNG|nr:hypothetical protein BB560_002487 [Smittium megazygosporum]
MGNPTARVLFHYTLVFNLAFKKISQMIIFSNNLEQDTQNGKDYIIPSDSETNLV